MIVVDDYRFDLLEMCSRVKQTVKGEERLLFATLTYEFKDLRGTWTGMVWNQTSGHSAGIKCRNEDDAYAWFEKHTKVAS